MLYFNFPQNFQDIERDLKEIRLQNIKESKIPEQKYKAKVTHITSFGFILESWLVWGEVVHTLQSGLLQDFSPYCFMEFALFCDVRLLVLISITSNREL